MQSVWREFSLDLGFRSKIQYLVIDGLIVSAEGKQVDGVTRRCVSNCGSFIAVMMLSYHYIDGLEWAAVFRGLMINDSMYAREQCLTHRTSQTEHVVLCHLHSHLLLPAVLSIPSEVALFPSSVRQSVRYPKKWEWETISKQSHTVASHWNRTIISMYVKPFQHGVYCMFHCGSFHIAKRIWRDTILIWLNQFVLEMFLY